MEIKWTSIHEAKEWANSRSKIENKTWSVWEASNAVVSRRYVAVSGSQQPSFKLTGIKNMNRVTIYNPRPPVPEHYYPK